MDKFFDNVAKIIEQARKHVGRTIDLTMCITYFEVGRMIVEEEQGGETRAKYGSELLMELSQFLGRKFGSGFSETNLRNSRKFYQIYSPSIQQAMSAELENQKGQTLSDEFKNDKKLQKLQLLPIESYPFRLNWSH